MRDKQIPVGKYLVNRIATLKQLPYMDDAQARELRRLIKKLREHNRQAFLTGITNRQIVAIGFTIGIISKMVGL